MSILSEIKQKEHDPTPQAKQGAGVILNKWASEFDPDSGNFRDIRMFDSWPRTSIEETLYQGSIKEYLTAI